jgi:hypothetical protein
MLPAVVLGVHAGILMGRGFGVKRSYSISKVIGRADADLARPKGEGGLAQEGCLVVQTLGLCPLSGHFCPSLSA